MLETDTKSTTRLNESEIKAVAHSLVNHVSRFEKSKLTSWVIGYESEEDQAINFAFLIGKRKISTSKIDQASFYKAFVAEFGRYGNNRTVSTEHLPLYSTLFKHNPQRTMGYYLTRSKNELGQINWKLEKVECLPKELRPHG